jgi:large subunit ribosomal protein L23
MKSPVHTRKSEAAAKSVTKPKKTKLRLPITLKPRLSEKGYALSEQLNTYIFDVPSKVNKFDIALAVAAQYDVSVTNVRLANIPGKAVRSYRNRGRRSVSSTRSDIRKAYVTLKQGDKLPIFAAVEEPEMPKETR